MIGIGATCLQTRMRLRRKSHHLIRDSLRFLLERVAGPADRERSLSHPIHRQATNRELRLMTSRLLSGCRLRPGKTLRFLPRWSLFTWREGSHVGVCVEYVRVLC